MGEALDSLFGIKLSELFYKEEELRIKNNLGMLRKTLSKHQRKLLLRIIDDKDLIQEKRHRIFIKKAFVKQPS